MEWALQVLSIVVETRFETNRIGYNLDSCCEGKAQMTIERSTIVFVHVQK